MCDTCQIIGTKLFCIKEKNTWGTKKLWLCLKRFYSNPLHLLWLCILLQLLGLWLPRLFPSFHSAQVLQLFHFTEDSCHWIFLGALTQPCWKSCEVCSGCSVQSSAELPMRRIYVIHFHYMHLKMLEEGQCFSEDHPKAERRALCDNPSI